MKLFTTLAITLCLLLCAKAQGQPAIQPLQTINADSLQKVHVDSVQRAWMKDSLNLSDQTITTVFALRDTAFARTERIRENQSLTSSKKNVAIRILRNETAEAIKNTMGNAAYIRYLELIVGGNPE